MKWLELHWYEYLFSKGLFDDGLVEGLRRFMCRIDGHSCGVMWYSSGFEPNMNCKNCGEYLG